MSAPKYDCYNVDLNTMTVSYIGRIEVSDRLKHPKGWVFVREDDGVFLHTPDSKGWRTIDGEAVELTIITHAADRPANKVAYFERMTGDGDNG